MNGLWNLIGMKVPSSAQYWLCDPGQAMSPFWAPVSPSVKCPLPHLGALGGLPYRYKCPAPSTLRMGF